jgi:zinc transport system permease protein
MLELWYHAVDLLPGDWTRFLFMKQALLAILLVMPPLSLLGVLVVNQRMAFFSDVIGHSALTGLALGTLCGLVDPSPAMPAFAALLAVLVSLLKRFTRASTDTVIAVLFALVVSAGVVLLSRGGGFAKYTPFLIGDFLTLAPTQLVRLAGVSLLVGLGLLLMWKPLFLISLSPSLARSRGIPVFGVETGFAVLVAFMVAAAVPLIGILIVNSILILPAATARLWAPNLRAYFLIALLLGLTGGIAGLLLSFYWGTACGATCSLLIAGAYLIAAFGRVQK